MNATSTATRTPRPSRNNKTAGRLDPAPENIASELAAFVVPIASLTLHPRNPRRGNLCLLYTSDAADE